LFYQRLSAFIGGHLFLPLVLTVGAAGGKTSELRSDAQGGAFLENGRSPGERSLTVAALIGVAVTSIGAATVRERVLGGNAPFHHSLETPLGVMSNLCHLLP
jgi:hypothetical protein